jgi:hypothetical protein
LQGKPPHDLEAGNSETGLKMDTESLYFSEQAGLCAHLCGQLCEQLCALDLRGYVQSYAHCLLAALKFEFGVLKG